MHSYVTIYLNLTGKFPVYVVFSLRRVFQFNGDIFQVWFRYPYVVVSDVTEQFKDSPSAYELIGKKVPVALCRLKVAFRCLEKFDTIVGPYLYIWNKCLSYFGVPTHVLEVGVIYIQQ